MHRWSLRPLGVSGMITTMKTYYVAQRREVATGEWWDGSPEGSLEDAREYRDWLVRHFPNEAPFRIIRRDSEITETVVE